MLILSAGEVGQLYRFAVFIFTHVHGITHNTEYRSRRNIEGLLWVGRGHYSKVLIYCICIHYPSARMRSEGYGSLLATFLCFSVSVSLSVTKLAQSSLSSTLRRRHV